MPPLQALEVVDYVEEACPPFVPANNDTVAYLGFSGDFDPHLMQYYKYNDNEVASFFKCSARQMQADPAFPVQFLAYADYRGKAVRDEIAAQRKRLKELTRGTEDRLLRLFFRLVYPTYPIVDRKKFYADYSRGSENIDICLYSGLLAISVIWNKYDEVLCVKNLPHQLYDKLFDECAIAVERSLKHPTLGTVQGLLLLAQKHIIQSDNSKIFSENLHIAKLVSVSHTLGLHLDCSNWSISASEKRLRKRIWATVYMVEKWSSANLGSPSLLTYENSTWEQYEEEDPSSLLFVHFGKLTHILDRIMQELYSVRNYAERYNNPMETIAKVDKFFVTLQFWRNELPPELKEMGYLHENELKKNGILHLAELTIAVLLHRIKLHPSCTKQLDRPTLLKYRAQAGSIIQRIVKYTSAIDNPHLKSFWHSMVRLNFSTLFSFVLFHHITSTSKKEFEDTKQVMNKWSKTLQGLSKSWGGGTGLAVERASTVYLSGNYENIFDFEKGLVMYTKDTDRLNEEDLKREKEEALEKEKTPVSSVEPESTSDSGENAVKEETQSPDVVFNTVHDNFPPALTDSPRISGFISTPLLQPELTNDVLAVPTAIDHHSLFGDLNFIDTFDDTPSDLPTSAMEEMNANSIFGPDGAKYEFNPGASDNDPERMLSSYMRHLQQSYQNSGVIAGGGSKKGLFNGISSQQDFSSFWFLDEPTN